MSTMTLLLAALAAVSASCGRSPAGPPTQHQGRQQLKLLLVVCQQISKAINDQHYLSAHNNMKA